MGDRKERNPMEVHATEARIRIERDVEEEVAGFMRAETERRAGNEQPTFAARFVLTRMLHWDQPAELGELWHFRGPQPDTASRSNRRRARVDRRGSAVAHALLIRGRCESAPPAGARRIEMLETIAIILLVLWLLGVVSGYTLGNFIYILLVIAIVLFLVRLVSGRRG